MISVGIKELKAKLSSYVDRAQRGEDVIVTDHGKEVAILMPVTGERRRLRTLQGSGRAEWSGGKPAASKATVRVKGKPLSKTVLEERR